MLCFILVVCVGGFYAVQSQWPVHHGRPCVKFPVLHWRPWIHHPRQVKCCGNVQAEPILAALCGFRVRPGVILHVPSVYEDEVAVSILLTVFVELAPLLSVQKSCHSEISTDKIKI